MSMKMKALVAAFFLGIVMGEPSALPFLFVGRDRDPEPCFRRKQSSWWQEINDPAIVSDDLFRAEARVPRKIFAFILKAIEKDPIYNVGVHVGKRAIPVSKQLMGYLLRVGSNTTTSIVAHRWVSLQVPCLCAYDGLQRQSSGT